ncbi:MAG: DNA polymerase beta superfamily protein, partial [Persicimonas sp.]
MSLTFEKPAEMHPLESPAEASWAEWAGAHEPPARFLSVWSGPPVHGYDGPVRVAGVLAQPAELVLGIRSWNDAFEGTLDLSESGDEIPYALFEVEKIVRMMLHQSGLALEILASPTLLVAGGNGRRGGELFPARRIVESAITGDIIHHYRDVAGRWLERIEEAGRANLGEVDAREVARNALTGRALMEGRVAFDLWTLAERYGDGALVDLLRQLDVTDEPGDDWLAGFVERVGGLVD